MRALIASAFLRSKRGVALTRVTSKASTISATSRRRSSAIDRAEQGEEDQSPRAARTAVAVVEQVGLGVALDSLRLPSPVTRGRCVGERTVADPDALERLEQRDQRGGGQQVLAAQDVRTHQRVIEQVGQRVERRAVPAGQHEVGHLPEAERDLSAGLVVEREVFGPACAGGRRARARAERRWGR